MFFLSSFYANFWWTVHKVMSYPSLMENSLLIYCFSEMMQMHLNSVSVMPILNDTEVLSLPVVSSPLFSVFGLNPKGPKAFSGV